MIFAQNFLFSRKVLAVTTKHAPSKLLSNFLRFSLHSADVRSTYNAQSPIPDNRKTAKYKRNSALQYHAQESISQFVL